MSIRLRLTLLYTAVLVAVLIGFSAALYIGQEQQTLRQVERGLRGAVGGAMALTAHRHEPPPLRPPDQGPRMASIYLQTRDVEGHLVDRNDRLGDSELPLGPEAMSALLRGESWTEQVDVDGVPMLVHSQSQVRDGAVVGVLQAGASLDLLDDYLHGLRLSLLLVTGLAAAIAFVGGWFLAGEALRPIDRITRAAHEIGVSRDFGRRVPQSRANDELGHLARTFNDMLAQLEAAYVSVAETLETQRRFVADASHELRTPLTTIRGNAELLSLDPPISRPDRKAALADIVGETDRLIALVADLLVLARADAGRQPERAAVAMDTLLDDVVRQARLLAPDRAVDREIEPGLIALGDRDATRQILLNLLENAFRHTPAGTAVRLEAVAADGHVVVRVADDGPGIAPEDVDRVFERFQRGRTSRTGPGSGLGLSIARALAEAQGGAIAVASRPGVGTTFTLQLPAASGDPPPEQHPLVGAAPPRWHD